MSLWLGFLISKMRVIIVLDRIIVKNALVDICEGRRTVPDMELALKIA